MIHIHQEINPSQNEVNRQLRENKPFSLFVIFEIRVQGTNFQTKNVTNTHN